jgi:parallel beta-helix repeat protein
MGALRLLVAASLMALSMAFAARAQTCDVIISSGESIADGVSATPSNGTLCINSGNYLLTETVEITGPMSVLGVDTGAGLPVITQSGAFAMFAIEADNVEIAFLPAQGYEHANSDSCDGANFVLGVGWGYQNIHDNVLDTFTCGVSLEDVHDGLIKNNQISTVKYGGIALSTGVNFTISGNQLTVSGALSAPFGGLDRSRRARRGYWRVLLARRRLTGCRRASAAR